MINFFRRIRQRLLTENIFTKYLAYAIGEIVLVVIGILIALQINDWNENKKIKAEEIIFLNSIKEDLINDLAQLDNIYSYQNSRLNTIHALMNELKDRKIKNFKGIDSLYNKTQTDETFTFFPNNGAYTTSKSTGIINNLKPVELKTLITNLYERYYNRLIYNGEIYDSQINAVAIKRGAFYNPMTNKLLNIGVIENPEFLNLISVMEYDNSFYVKLSLSTKIEIQNVLEQIEERLK